MRKYLLSATAIMLVLSAGSALAADLPSRKGPPEYVPPPPPMWTGFYAGLNAGWSWGNSDQVSSQTYSGTVDHEGASHGGASALSGTGVASAPMSGVIGGGQIGYDHQFSNNFVLGIEADIQGAGLQGNGYFVGAGSANYGLNNDTVLTGVQTQRTLDWLGTVRPRIGYLATPNLLIYGTGGLAYGGVTADTHIAGGWSGGFGTGAPVTNGGVGHYSNTLMGWTAGAGVEWMFAPNWSVKAEYLYYDLGSATWNTPWSVSGSIPGVGNVSLPNITTSHTRFDGHIVRGGLNYHFNWFTPPVVAGY
jgi:outer membrane immunogenic protein